MNVTASRLKRAFVSFLSMMLALQLVLPNVALAAQREVELDNHTMETDQTSQISDIYIDDVDGPKTGTQLDDEAVVTTAEKNTWDIPVLWVRDDMQVDRDAADDGHDYLPALAFFVPQEYALSDDTFTVTLSESLTELFGSEETSRCTTPQQTSPIWRHRQRSLYGQVHARSRRQGDG